MLSEEMLYSWSSQTRISLSDLGKKKPGMKPEVWSDTTSNKMATTVDGLERCRTCEVGSYQAQYAAISCMPCPQGIYVYEHFVSNEDKLALKLGKH